MEEILTNIKRKVLTWFFTNLEKKNTQTTFLLEQTGMLKFNHQICVFIGAVVQN